MKIVKTGNVIIKGSDIEITDWHVEGGSADELSIHARLRAMWILFKSFLGSGKTRGLWLRSIPRS